MKLNDAGRISKISEKIDEIYDPKKNLNGVLAKTKPKLALEVTPTKRHNLAHDLFRIYTYNLLKDLSRKFEIILIYRDIQATIALPLEESKRLIQESISLLHNSKVPFKMYYESEILQKHLINMPERFFRHLYSNVLHKDHNHFKKDLMVSSTSQAVLMPLLELLNIDVLLCMSKEKENMNLLRKIQGKNDYFPIIFYRSLRDMENKEHSFEDLVRAFPKIGQKEKYIYSQFKKYGTDFETFLDWYRKLGTIENKSFEYENGKISFKKLYGLVKSEKITKEAAIKQIVRNLFNFMEKEGKFLELASKEVKLYLESKDSDKILNCLNTPSRINIIKLLDKSNMSAHEIAKLTNLSLPTILFHLSKMQEAGIIVRNNNKTYGLKINRFILYI